MSKRENIIDVNEIRSEWKMIHKPDHIAGDTLFVIAACLCGLVVTGLIGTGMNVLVSLLVG